MVMRGILVFCVCMGLSSGILYDRYTSRPLTSEKITEYQQNNALDRCAIDLKPCNASEGSRVDGTCNNIEYPIRGAYLVPMIRMLPADIQNGTRLTKSRLGNDLPLPRSVCTQVLDHGKSYHKSLTQLVPGYGIFTFMDIGSIHDIEQFLFTKTDCCVGDHITNDPECSPNLVPEDDPVHRFTGIRCLNLTTPLTYQYYNCTKDPIPAPIARATTAYDLSQIYNYRGAGDQVVRSFKSGQLAVEEESGKLWPPTNDTSADCPLNRGSETRCYQNYINGLLPININVVWAVRYHNYLAKELSTINPCWDDEKLFQVAREINIATAMQIYLYGWMPAVIGTENLVKAGVISDDPGFRDIYDENSYPNILLEFAYALRWFHTMQDASAKMYDPKGNFLEDFPMFNLTLRTGWLARDKNVEQVTQGFFRQPCRDTNHGVDYDMGERGLVDVQNNVDVPTSDLHKGRLFYLPPYIDYVYSCLGINITSFEDLAPLMSSDMIMRLSNLYPDVYAIDLMAGLWGEEVMEGGRIPPTLACIIKKNMLIAIKGDRHWYERKNRSNAFTAEQLAEVRKSTLSTIICTVGDDVAEIQPNPFHVISPATVNGFYRVGNVQPTPEVLQTSLYCGNRVPLTFFRPNPLVSCSEIPKPDLAAWVDSACNSVNGN